MVYKTKKCIVCSKQAVNWAGHVLGKEKMALGNYIDKKIIAGFCDEHIETIDSDENGCYGEYNKETMGECIAFRFQ